MTDDKMAERMKEAYKNYVPRKPPEENNNRCHNCDMPFVPEQWDVRHINTPNTLGESWIYTCPSCEEETVEIGT